ncbi:molybdopterin cofactor-binding domain-containing protein [Pigmentiphaga soli]
MPGPEKPAPLVGVGLVPHDQVDSFIAVDDHGKVTAFNGHVDLGTGLRTALGQIVAEELDVRFDDVTMVLGDTGLTPDQGGTTASASIQSAAVPMRRAAAQARAFLVAQAAERLGVPAAGLEVRDGTIWHAGRPTDWHYGRLLEGRRFEMRLAADAAVKDPCDYRIVGKPQPRVDIPAKATGRLTYVHDLRLPGMLHARVVRPPYAGRDIGPLAGSSLEWIDPDSVAHLPGIVKVVAIRDFVAVVATREEVAIKAARALKLRWRPWPALPDMNDLAAALRDNPARVRPLKDSGDVDDAPFDAAGPLQATYLWPYQMHGSIGPSCGVARYEDGMLTVWSGTQLPHVLHGDIAALVGLPADRVRLVRMEASGCYGRNCADDAAAEAALLAYELGRPVRVQLMRDEEHAWEPKGTAQLLEVRGGLDESGGLVYDFSVRYPSNNAPILALAYTGRGDPHSPFEHKGDRTAVPQYRCGRLRVRVCDMHTIVRAAWMRGVSAMPNVFAHESFIDELAARHRADPVEFRLRLMDDERAIALTRAVAARAGRQPAPRPARRPAGRLLRGRGFAQHQYVHGSYPGTGAAWCAWACEVEVDTETGKIAVRKVWVGYDCGQVINPDGVRHQIHGNVIQSCSRVLKERVLFDAQGVASVEWGAYPILSFTEIPEIDVLIMPANGNPPLGAGESASVPSAAAIANAVYDAAGIRLREVPFTPDRVLAALAAARHE